MLNAAEVLAPAVVSRDRDEELFDLLAAVCLTGPGVSGCDIHLHGSISGRSRGGGKDQHGSRRGGGTEGWQENQESRRIKEAKSGRGIGDAEEGGGA